MNGIPDPTSDNVKAYWDSMAEKHGCGKEATCPDVYLRGLEIHAVGKYLRSGMTVLDIGCGNGYGTNLYANTGAEVKGVDFSPKMIDVARATYDTLAFDVADVTNLSNEESNSYTAVITDRCLINLTNAGDFNRAIGEIHRVLKPKGIYFMVECWRDGHDGIDSLRKYVGLDPIPIRWNNRYLTECEVYQATKSVGLMHSVVEHFASLYTVVSKVVYARVCAGKAIEPDYLNDINRVVSILPSFGPYGSVRLDVWVKG
jgi:ubiquinone/menaquinone biosynthesis C-methylase UbiE